MATTRQSIVRGPGSVTFGNVTLFDQGGITAEIDSATQEIASSISGRLDTIKTDQIGKITLTPVGELSDNILAALFPSYLRTPALGTSVFGATDKTLAVASLAGTKVTFNCAALTKCPDLFLSPVKTALGSCEFTALVPNGKLPDDATSKLYTVAAETYAGGSPSRSNLTGNHYTATFGSLSIPDTLDGWTLTVEQQLEPVTTDSQGTIDYTLTGVNVTAKCTPLGLSESQILAALAALQGRGSSIAGASDLTIASTNGLTVVLKNASLVTGPLNWGATALRAGELGFTANINTSTGALFTLALASSD